ncbi:hypothetical protein C7999DRAFT_44828 [Corynascus novoguineensis]|uniref:Glutamine amidotransferase type-2 domain-containing protein n=1 Tax=Corynascus novoguineensis TaxID=1126955 RepID=A0AAN7CLP2_9PEZI|nr:hypothetical protein C7999DRAFT_44828 [Corynascus novoguineensis]
MCGISVSIALDRRQRQPRTPETRAELEEKLSKSLDLIAHRGPDAKGIWINDDASVDHSPCNKIHAVVNGEIYDPGDALRGELEAKHGYLFSSRSDTELVVALYAAHGAPGFLSHLRGEFSLVLYDERDDKVILARDRFGIKPLFYTVVDDRLLIAAEAKAFLALGWAPEWDVGAIAEGVWQGGERTLFEGVNKVSPGGWVEVSAGGELTKGTYWDPEYNDKRVPETRSVEEMVLGVRERLIEATRMRLRADVPVGIYLSGGIDSSLLAGIVTQLVKEEGVKMGNRDATNRICCFSIEFPSDASFNEADIAERTANWLGVQILKKRMDEATLAENFADSAYHTEHHNMDLNSVGKFCLSTLPREHGFKVVLTGEGSDEHFSGYPFFLPDMLREPDLATPDSVLSKDNELRERLKDKAQKDFEFIMFSRAGGFKDEMADTETLRELNDVNLLSWTRIWQPTLSIFAPWVREQWAGTNPQRALAKVIAPEVKEQMRTRWHPVHSAQYLWVKTMLANNLLTCLGDRTEMAHSIEARPPFLDHVVSEYVNALPPSVKWAYTPDAEERNGLPWANRQKIVSSLFSEKWILREAAKPYITQELYERKKHPYVAPNRWPKDGPLHKKLSEICTQEAVEELGFVDWEVVRGALDKAFGEDAEPLAFRILLVVGGWVTIGQRFGVKRAERKAA